MGIRICSWCAELVHFALNFEPELRMRMRAVLAAAEYRVALTESSC